MPPPSCHACCRLLSRSPHLGQTIHTSQRTSRLRVKAGHERCEYTRNRPLGRDRYGNEYWRFGGDTRLVLVRRHGCWWGLYDGPEKVCICVGRWGSVCARRVWNCFVLFLFFLLKGKGMRSGPPGVRARGACIVDL